MRNRILSICLSFCMVLSTMPFSAMAQEANAGANGEIISFAPLTQTDKTVTKGTNLKDLELPQELTATVRTAVDKSGKTSEEPKSSTEEPASSAEESKPDAEQSAPSSEEPKPNSEEPAPSSEEPKPDAEQSAPSSEEPIQNQDTATESISSPTLEGSASEQQVNLEVKTAEIPVTWDSKPEYDKNTEGVYVFTPVIKGYTVSAELPKITVKVETAQMMLRMGAPTTYGDFSVSVDEDGAAPTYNEGVLTFGTAGEYTVAMAGEKTTTSNVIMVNATGEVKLNLDGVNITAPNGAMYNVGGNALTVTSGTVTLNVIADCSLQGGTGGTAGMEITPAGNGGAGVIGNVTVTGTATLTVTGGSGGSALMGTAGSAGMAISNASRSGGGKITVREGYTVKAGSNASTAVVLTEATTNAQYVSFTPPDPVEGSTTYGDFSVSVDEDGVAPTYNEGVLTFGKAGEYTVGMASEKTSTTDRIVVSAANVTLNLDGVTINAPNRISEKVDGDNAFTVTSDSVILNLLKDSSFIGGLAGIVDPMNACNGGSGISGNITLTGTATLTATGGQGGATPLSNTGNGGAGVSGNVTVRNSASLIAIGGLYGGANAKGGTGISGNLTVTGSATVSATGGYSSPYGSPGNALTGTLTATGFILKGGFTGLTDEISSNDSRLNQFRYLSVEPASLPTAAEYAAASPAAASDTDYVLDSDKKTLTIKTAKGAAFWSASDKDYLDYTVLLADDIDVSAFQWTPVGTSDGSFTGSFDGQGHTITGMTVTVNNVIGSSVGLFGKTLNATIENVGLLGSSVTVTEATGGYVNDAGNIVGFASKGKIKNCYSTGSVAISGTSIIRAGGIVSYASNVEIENCYNTGNVTTTGNNDTYAGGIVAFKAENTTVTNCYYLSTATITGTNSNLGNPLTEVQMKAGAGTENALIDSLNQWVNNKASTDYYTWQADSTSDPVNKGYPVLGEKWEAPATKYNVWVGNVQVTSANSNAITGDGITGTVTYNHDTNTLTLDGATITSGHLIEDFEGPAGIYVDGNLNLELKSDNTITGVSPSSGKCSFAVYNNGNLTIKGNGALNATGGDTESSVSYGLYTTHDLSIQDNATVNVNSGNATNGNCWGVMVGDALTIQGSASLIATGGTSTGENGSSYGVYVSGYTKVKDSARLSATSGAAEFQSYGIFISNNNSFEISGGTVTASTTDIDGASQGSAAINKKPSLLLYKPAPLVMASNIASGMNAIRTTLNDINIQTFQYIHIVPSSLPTAEEYASASPAADSNTDYVLDSNKKTLTIKTAKGAAFWSASGKNYLDYTVSLDDDIDVSAFQWTPVGTSDGSFTGSFNGQGHTITGLTVDIYAGNEAVYAGLFGMTGGSIKNVGLANASIVVSNTATDSKQVFAGGLAGEAFDGAITNCFVMGGTVSASSGYGSYAGGLVGFGSNDITVSNCYSTSSVTTSGTSGHSGGVAGCIGAGTIKGCYYLNSGTGMPEKGIGRVHPNCEPVITGCGTIGSNNSKLAAGTEEQFTSQQALAYGTLFNALNGWVDAEASGDYYTWQADTGSINGGYPVFNALWGTTTPVYDNCFKYVKTKKPNDPGSYMDEYHYDFDGWYTEQNGDGTKLGDSDDGAAGTRYYAKWIKNGKIVRTTALDLTDISESNLYRSNKSGDVYTNAAEGWTWYAAKTTVGSNSYAANTLVLSGLNINTAATATALKVPGGTTIVLTEGTINSASSGYTSSGSEAVYTYGVYGAGALNIKGGGTLSAFAGTAAYTKSNNSYGGFSHGIYSAGALNITEGIISAKGGFGGPTGAENKSYGIYSNSTIDISGGTVAGNGGGGKAESGGIAAEGDIKITGGAVTGQGGAVNFRPSIGIMAQTGKISITGGIVSATGGASTGDDDSSASVGVFADKVEISQGTVTAIGGNAASGGASCGISAISSVAVTGGRVTAKNGAAVGISAAMNVYTGALTVGGTEKLATIENATDGTNAITSSSGSIASKKLVMSGSDAVKVSFATYAITANAATNGSYTVKVDGSAVTSAQSNEKVTITPTANSGYEVDAISVCKTGDTSTTVTVSSNAFTMPAYPVTICVTFKKKTVDEDLTGVGYHIADGKLTGTTANMEYSLDGGSTWKPCTQGETANLTFTAGSVKVRQKDKTTNERTVVTIAVPAASTTPTLESKTANSVKLNAIAGYEYSKDGGITWQNSNVFLGLTANTAYHFVARKKATATTLPGTLSAELSVTTAQGSSSDKSSDSNSSTPAPSNKPAEPVTGETANKAVIDGRGTASVRITDQNIADAIANAKAEAEKKGLNAGEITVKINVSADGANATNFSVNLPKSTQQQVIGNKVAGIELAIDRPDLTLGINLAAVTEINRQANADVQLTVTRTDATRLSPAARTTIGNRPTFDFKASYENGSKHVTNFGNGTVYVSVPYTPANNEAVGYLYMTYVDVSGNAVRVPGSAYDVNSKSLIFVTNHFSVYGVGYTAPPAQFTDIRSHWAKESVDYAVGRGLFGGRANAKFTPDTAITRGDLVTALGKLAGVNVASYAKNSFTDVKAGSYYMPYLEWAYSKGILTGNANNKIAPESAVTREEIAVILQNYMHVTGRELPATRSAGDFADASSIGNKYQAAVAAMQQAGVLMGKKNNQFAPKANATRAEVSAMLHRYTKLTIDPTTAQGWARNDAGEWTFFMNGKPVTGAKEIDGFTYTFDPYGITADIRRKK
ncbi:S-layer homology domain-containing protein [Clostridium merdae]|uniref:S-layer homology domain-containing protein n=1 Tax=Clostridium merdae TaxID=1958780 RepID=UPI000A26D249|nr:S-layer homology domain-containing protein [Clostridium merdae]